MWTYLNTTVPFNGPTYDEKFVRGLLIEFFGFQKLAGFDLEKSTLQFMRGKFFPNAKRVNNVLKFSFRFRIIFSSCFER